MKRGRKETSHETLPSSIRLCHGGGTYIPFDITVEILRKLPGKSLVRFQSVSKLWLSTISTSRDFIDSIVTRSLNQPPRDAHLIFDYNACYYKDCFLGFTSSTNCPSSTKQVSILSIPGKNWQYVRGLFFSWSDYPKKAAIYNLTARQTFYLPETTKDGHCFFGYDPLENRYKALLIPGNSMELACQIFTLGDPTAMQWRSIQGVESHLPVENVVCINGLIHYRAYSTNVDRTYDYKLISFDVRTEKFYHMEAPETIMDYHSTLINYKGKLGFLCCKKGIEIWVMENATQVWSRIFFYEMDGYIPRIIHGATRGGEIVFSDSFYTHPDTLHVLYYDLNRNSMRRVDIKSTCPEERRCSMSHFHIMIFLDHVENTMCLYQTIN